MPPRRKTTKSSSSSKSHPLEGDGCLVNLFSYLQKPSLVDEMKPCRVLIPDTVVYEHNFPREWIYTDSKEELKKRAGKELDVKTIQQEFTQPIRFNASAASSVSNSKQLVDLDVLAFYISTKETKNGEKVSVDFFNKKDLDFFLMNGSRKEAGILQRFIVPKGQKNSIIQAIWSPHVTLVERRTNKHKVFDKKAPIFDRSVTYEGPSHYSSEVFVAPQLVSNIKSICERIVKHVAVTEKKKISRMVLYFKVDPQDRIWLLWSSSLRIQDDSKPRKMTISNNRNSSSTPLKLSLRFAEPDNVNKAPPNAISSFQDDEKKKTSGSSFGAPQKPKTKKQKKTTESVLPTFKCPNCGKKSSSHRHTLPLHVVLEAYKDEISQSSPSRKSLSHSPKKSFQNDEFDMEMTKQQKKVIEQLDDLLYEAYSHFLHSYDPFRFSLPSELPADLSQQLKENLMNLGVQETDDRRQLFIQHHTVSIGKLHKEFENTKRLLSSNTRSISQHQADENEDQNSAYNVSDMDDGEDPTEEYKRNDQVPRVILKFLPNLTNASYRELRKEPLFMSRPIPLCETCFMKITDLTPTSTIKRSLDRKMAQTRRRSSSNGQFGKEMELPPRKIRTASSATRKKQMTTAVGTNTRQSMPPMANTMGNEDVDKRLFENFDRFMENM